MRFVSETGGQASPNLSAPLVADVCMKKVVQSVQIAELLISQLIISSSYCQQVP